MNALPVIAREMIVRARSPRMHWMRVVLAAIGVLFCLQYFLIWTGPGLAQAGGFAFQTLAWTGFLGANAGFVLTADSVSSERREGTLGLLLLTRIGILDVLAGKLASAGLGALLGLVAIAPVLMLPVLAGGVRWTQAVLAALSLPGLLFFSLCVGLWASSNSMRAAQALSRSTRCMALIVLLPLVLSGLLTKAGQGEWSLWMRSLSPGGAFLLGSSTTATVAGAGYWTSVTAGFAFGGMLLAAASRSLRLNWREDAGSEAVRFTRNGKRAALVGDEAPMQWLLRRSEAQPRAVWLGIGLLLLPLALNLVAGRAGVGRVGIAAAFHLAASFAASLLFSYAGATFFLEGRRTGALELLRTTPEGVARGVSDQWAILRRRIVGPLVIWVTLNILLQLFWRSRSSGLNMLFEVWQTLVGLSGTVFDVIALCWLGMWFGYRSGTAWSALLWPVGLVTGLDLVLTYGWYGVSAVALRSVVLRGGPGAGFVLVYLIMPVGITIAKQIWLILWAKRRLGEVSSGAPMEPVELRRWIALSARRARVAVRKARHWTPGGGT